MKLKRLPSTVQYLIQNKVPFVRDPNFLHVNENQLPSGWEKVIWRSKIKTVEPAKTIEEAARQVNEMMQFYELKRG